MDSASEVFQKKVAVIIEDVDGTKNYQDDIVVWVDGERKWIEIE